MSSSSRLDILHFAQRLDALPTYGFKGLQTYAELWANRRWGVAYSNLFFFSAFYVTSRWPSASCWPS